MTVDRLAMLLIGYLLGSIPFGYLYSRWIEGVNIREKGSGNIGATNLMRNFGWIPGFSTLFADGLKGALPAGFCYYYAYSGELTLALAVGGMAILGHIYPLYLRFRGGKGVATSAGVFLVLAPLETLGALVVFLAGVGITRYMSVGSLSGALALPLISSYYYGPSNALSIACLLLAIMIFWQHRGNIRRLVRGEEHTFF